MDKKDNNTRKTRQHILLTPNLRPVPPGIRIDQQFGDLLVVFGNDERHRGLHCLISGDIDTVRQWLHSKEYIIVGNGIPAMETFAKVTMSSGELTT